MAEPEGILPGRTHQLPGLAAGALLAKDGPQDLMAVDEQLEGSLQHLFIEVAVKNVGGGNIVGNAAALHLAQQPQPPLCRRQRIVRLPGDRLNRLKTGLTKTPLKIAG